MAGTIAAAATVGVLLGLGRARGAAFDLLNDTAHLVLGERARLVSSAHLTVTTIAMLVHIASLLAWGVLFTLFAASLRGWRLAIAAVVFAGTILAIDILLLPAALRPGFETAMTSGELVLLYAVMAAALALGLRVVPQRPVA